MPSQLDIGLVSSSLLLALASPDQGLSRFEFAGALPPETAATDAANLSTTKATFWRTHPTTNLTSANLTVSSSISATISSTLSLTSPSGAIVAARTLRTTTSNAAAVAQQVVDVELQQGAQSTATTTSTTGPAKFSRAWWWEEEDFLAHIFYSGMLHLMMCLVLWSVAIMMTFPCFPVMILPPEFRALFFVSLSSGGAVLLAFALVRWLDHIHAALGIVSWWLQLFCSWLVASWSFPMVLAVCWFMGSGNCIESLDILFPYLIIFEVRDIYFSLLCRCRGRSVVVCLLKILMFVPGLMLIPTFMMAMAFFWCCSEVCICSCAPCVWIRVQAEARRLRYDRDRDGGDMEVIATKSLSTTRAYIGRATEHDIQEDDSGDIEITTGRGLFAKTKSVTRCLKRSESSRQAKPTRRASERQVQFHDDMELAARDARSNSPSATGVTSPRAGDRASVQIPAWKFASPRRFSSAHGGVPNEETLDQSQKLIVLSVRSATSSSPFLSFMLDLVHKHEDLNDCKSCNPNTKCTNFCGPPKQSWDENWQCRGECFHPTSAPQASSQTPYGLGFEPSKAPCWRSCFKRHLERAHISGGCMLQIIERASCEKGDYSGAIEYGGGQCIEEILADQVGIKVFQIQMPELAACINSHQLCDGPPSLERQAVDEAFNDFVEDFNTWSDRTSFPSHWGSTGPEAAGDGDSFAMLCNAMA